MKLCLPDKQSSLIVLPMNTLYPVVLRWWCEVFLLHITGMLLHLLWLGHVVHRLLLRVVLRWGLMAVGMSWGVGVLGRDDGKGK